VEVESTIRPAKDRIAGFEGREGHRTPFASVVCRNIRLQSLRDVSNLRGCCFSAGFYWVSDGRKSLSGGARRKAPNARALPGEFTSADRPRPPLTTAGPSTYGLPPKRCEYEPPLLPDLEPSRALQAGLLTAGAFRSSAASSVLLPWERRPLSPPE